MPSAYILYIKSRLPSPVIATSRPFRDSPCQNPNFEFDIEQDVTCKPLVNQTRN